MSLKLTSGVRSGMYNILENIPDKTEDAKTTSLKFKKDLIDFLGDNYKNKKCLEVGSHKGYTTRVLSSLFKEVICCEWNPKLIEFSKKLNSDKDNISFIRKDIYNTKWEFQDIDVVLIDCNHAYENVMIDIKNSIEITERGKTMTLIFDDYGLDNPWRGVKEAVDDYLSVPNFNMVKHIGESKGWVVYPGKVLKDSEGVICSYENY